MKTSVGVLILLVVLAGNASAVPMQNAEDLARDDPARVRDKVNKATAETAAEFRHVQQQIKTTNNVDDVRRKAEAALEKAEEEQKYYSSLAEALTYEQEELRKQKQLLEIEKNVLKEERKQLTTDQEKLRQEKDLYSMGFYASFATILIGAAGIVVRYPANRLESKLRKLELLEREHELRQKNILTDP